ncbi:DegT/DnrJ/EryC1/StrS family aminotransferase [bacterium]|nr:DegT/DnrJ/EryC1/StrS family aminotransferase [bacterium]
MSLDQFIPLAKPHITDDEVDAVSAVIRSGWWSTGPNVKEFEEKFSQYLGHDTHSLAVNSCTSGLFLALKALDIGPGDEVIVPSLTFAATAHVVEWCGAKVVLCDVDEKTYNIDIEILSKLITSKTKVIIPVHISGFPCDMDSILDLAKQYDLRIIEDAAHAIGTLYKNKKIGSFGDITVYSFYATKNLACGEGGMVTTRDEKLLDKIRSLAYFGIDKSAFNRYEKRGTWYYQIEELGFKCNMDSMHAALGLVQLKKIDVMNEKRAQIASIYDKKLDRRFKIMNYPDYGTSSWHLYPIRLPLEVSRDLFIEGLKKRNIGSSVHFIPLHEHPHYIENNQDMAQLNSFSGQMLSLPMYPSLSLSDLDQVISETNDLLKELYE